MHNTTSIYDIIANPRLCSTTTEPTFLNWSTLNFLNTWLACVCRSHKHSLCWTSNLLWCWDKKKKNHACCKTSGMKYYVSKPFLVKFKQQQQKFCSDYHTLSSSQQTIQKDVSVCLLQAHFRGSTTCHLPELAAVSLGHCSRQAWPLAQGKLCKHVRCTFTSVALKVQNVRY